MLGTGILKGMVETAKNFAGSYHDPARLTTVEYPEERIASKENARQFPMLIHDTEDPMKGLRCVACQICEKECPPQCIYIVFELSTDNRFGGLLVTKHQLAKPNDHYRKIHPAEAAASDAVLAAEVAKAQAKAKADAEAKAKAAAEAKAKADAAAAAGPAAAPATPAPKPSSPAAAPAAAPAA
ncbi:MAG: 4Fe-4S ferredoxin [Proteobacteria bacterium]|nr:4Fe-4S ferredoxin [Pseudomonadota bacterium]